MIVRDDTRSWETCEDWRCQVHCNGARRHGSTSTSRPFVPACTHWLAGTCSSSEASHRAVRSPADFLLEIRRAHLYSPPGSYIRFAEPVFTVRTAPKQLALSHHEPLRASKCAETARFELWQYAEHDVASKAVLRISLSPLTPRLMAREWPLGRRPTPAA